MIPLIPALGVVAFSALTGAAVGCKYGKNPSESRNSVVECVDDWVGFLDRIGQFPVQEGTRFVVGLVADLYFGNPLPPKLTSEGFQKFTDMCREAGISERATRKLIQKVFHINRTDTVLESAE